MAEFRWKGTSHEDRSEHKSCVGVRRVKNYKCPLCGSKLPKDKYEAVLHIQQEKEKAQKAGLEKIQSQLREAQQAESKLKERLKDSRQKIKSARSEGAIQGARSEKQRQERLTLGLRKKLELANTRIKQLERGTTPQTEGLEFEENLWKRLQREFPEDRITDEGKGGDILHFVMFGKQIAGVIIYECKQTPRIKVAHISQAAQAKRTREAHFAILVTTGTRKGFAGLARVDNVLIVAPSGVVPLAHLCRAHLIEMAKAKLDNEQKNRVATQMLSFITSPTCRVPLEEVIQGSEKAQRLLDKEVKDHVHIWRERCAIYQNIRWDIVAIQSNVNRVLKGEKPLALEKHKVERLLLPAISES